MERARLGEIPAHSGGSGDAVAEAVDQQNDGDPLLVGEILAAKGEATPDIVLQAPNRQENGRPASASSSIRVDVGLLDKVMNLVGELVLARNHSMALARLRGRLRQLQPLAMPGPVVAAINASEATWKRF
jgi:two-component system chemotaxis sensor kinase CheA